MGGNKYLDLPPLHDLALLKVRVAHPDFRFGGVVSQFRTYFPDLSRAECTARIRTLVGQLQDADFACRANWRNNESGRQVVADTYGLADEEHGGYFVKFSVKDDFCTLHSCHPLNGDLELRCGKTLRIPR